MTLTELDLVSGNNRSSSDDEEEVIRTVLGILNTRNLQWKVKKGSYTYLDGGLVSDSSSESLSWIPMSVI